MARLDAFIASSIIALTGCTTAVQPKVEQKVVVRDLNAERRPGESLCDYMARNGIYSPEVCRRDKRLEEDLAKISRGVADMVAEVFWAQSSGYVRNCLYVQQYDLKSDERKKEKCIGEVLDILDADPNFQKVSFDMQEMVRQALREKIMER
jgi:hypothetical protein